MIPEDGEQSQVHELNTAACHYPTPYQLCVDKDCSYDARHCEVKDCWRYRQHQGCSKVRYQPYKDIEYQLCRQQKSVRSSLRFYDLQLLKDLERSHNPKAPRRDFINLRPIKRVFRKIREGRILFGREVSRALLPFQNYEINPEVYAQRSQEYGGQMQYFKDQILRLRKQANTNIFTPVVYQEDDSGNYQISGQQEAGQSQLEVVQPVQGDTVKIQNSQNQIQQPDTFKIIYNQRKKNGEQQLRNSTNLLSPESPHWKIIFDNLDQIKQVKPKFIASEHKNNFSGVKFHKRCDGIKNTLTIIRYGKQQLFAAFTPVPFDKQNQGYFSDNSRKSKIFWINRDQVFGLKENDQNGQNKAICSIQLSGPWFGKDIIIRDKCNKTIVRIQIGESYQNPNEEIQREIEKINEQKMFITEYQVFELIFTGKQANGVQSGLSNSGANKKKGNQKQTKFPKSGQSSAEKDNK